MINLALLGALKLSIFVRDNYGEKTIDRFKSLLIDRAEAMEGLRDEAEFLSNLSEEGEKMERLFAMTEGNLVAVNLLYLCALLYLRPEYKPLVNMLFPSNEEGISLKCAAAVTSYVDSIELDMNDVSRAYDLMELLLVTTHKYTDIMSEVFKWDDRLTAYLEDSFLLDRKIKEECEIYPAGNHKDNTVELFGYEDAAEKMAQDIKAGADNAANNNGFLRVIISGEKDCGRHTHARYAARFSNKGMLSVRYESLTAKQDMSMLRDIIRECLLSDYALCIRDIVSDENTELFIRKIQEHYSHFVGFGILFLLTDEKVKLVPSMMGPYLCYTIMQPQLQIATRLWSAFFEKYKLTGYDTDSLSALISVNAGQLKKLAGSIKEEEELTGRSLSDREICRLSYQILDDGRYENVHRIEPGYTLSDLKIDDKKKEILKEICDQVRLRHKVYDQWGMREKYAYGRSVSLLIAGPPGTGKTMAVHAIASELGLEMYKVDLSQVVDKYIGETEKRLEEVFKKAQKSNMILFFDEADAVMGKRTATSDAHDKSSNSQIAFILQRIEEYDGIVILATNLVNNIDSAFMRRIKYAITFDYPMKDTREQIWRGAFAQGVPLSEDIDFEYLAETFEISGAIIKNIVLNATFYAAAENGQVTMEHILRAVVRESNKDKSIISNANLGKYEYLLRN